MSEVKAKKPNWLIGGIVKIDYDAYKDKLGIYFKDKDELYYNEVTKEEFIPFYWKHKNKPNLYDVLYHKPTFREVKAERKLDYRNMLFLKPDTQFLIQQDLSYFKDITFDDLKMAVFDIETTSLSPEDGKILSIGFKTNFDINYKGADKSKRSIFFNEKLSETDMLTDFCKFIQEEDPDVLIGHNVFNFDIPFIEYRLHKCGLEPNLGRLNKAMYKDYRMTQVHALMDGKEFYQYKIPGRHVVDTMHLAMIEDTRRMEFEGYGLKYLAQFLSIAKKNRTYLEGHEIAGMYNTDFDRFMAYLTDDLEETMGLTKMLLPAYIQMSKIIPVDLQEQIYAGPTNKFTALFCRDYYKHRKPVPMSSEKRKFQGATSIAFESGLFYNISKFDVASLYPSINLVYKIFPKSDSLGSFEKYLKEFKTERLKFKHLAEDEFNKNGKTKLYEEYNAYQLALKILINSFYGVLGNEFFNWNDFDAAEAVTKKGREILQIMIETIEASKCKVISVDTDGAYFEYKPGVTDPRQILDKVNAALDEGIEVEYEKDYAAMFSYKAKNYAAITKDNKILTKGGAFKNRGMPPYMRKFIKNFLKYILTNNVDKVFEELFLLKRSIGDKSMQTSELIKKTNIKMDWISYKGRETGGKIPHFEAMEREDKTDCYKKGDSVLYYYKDGESKIKSDIVKLYDENDVDERDYDVNFYIEDLEKWLNKFSHLLKK